MWKPTEYKSPVTGKYPRFVGQPPKGWCNQFLNQTQCAYPCTWIEQPGGGSYCRSPPGTLTTNTGKTGKTGKTKQGGEQYRFEPSLQGGIFYMRSLVQGGSLGSKL
jgi:hypothetical protein